MSLSQSDMVSKGIAVSMVVDAFPEHYFKAELLLFSLSRWAGIEKTQIVVQCVDRVDEQFKLFVKSSGYHFREVSPYLDGAYCNKLQQLQQIGDVVTDVDGILLLDVDIIIVNKLELPSFDKVLGKIVDATNPPLTVLERIFSSAGIALPQRVPCDWNIGDTLATNFNGGFIYVPFSLVSEVSGRWRGWAEWLFARPELFDTPAQRIHIDQVSMALTLAEGQIPYSTLSANFNFPAHSDNIPCSFQQHTPLYSLNYHKELSEHGLVRPKLGQFPPVSEGVGRFNEAIVAHNDFVFFSAYKRSLIGNVLPIEVMAHNHLREALNEITQKLLGCRLILHVGTPKTGTTSLQRFLNKNRELLLEKGVFYPFVDSTIGVPKHQWLVGCLMNANEQQLAYGLQTACSDINSSIHTIILSTEGLFNHWWDYGTVAKSMLSVLTEYFDVEIWVWFRSPESFASSLYRQNLVNSRVMPCYGRDMSFKDMLEDAWFAKHVDYLGFVQEVQQVFGQDSIHVITYTGNTVSSCKALLGLNDLPDYPTLENQSIDQLGVDLVRIINRYELDNLAKARAVDIVKQLSDLVAKEYRQLFVIPENDLNSLKQITALGNSVLKKEFGLEFTR